METDGFNVPRVLVILVILVAIILAGPALLVLRPYRDVGDVLIVQVLLFSSCAIFILFFLLEMDSDLSMFTKCVSCFRT